MPVHHKSYWENIQKLLFPSQQLPVAQKQTHLSAQLSVDLRRINMRAYNFLLVDQNSPVFAERGTCPLINPHPNYSC